MNKRIGVLTSGGDAPGMNAAIRAVIRTALNEGAEAYAIYEGYQGLIQGGSYIRKMDWDDVGGILTKGGTLIGTARSLEFRSREGRLRAARNLLEHGIDNLVVIGGDGSLTGANTFRQEWPSLLSELVEHGSITQEIADAHSRLTIVGLVGSIDNDMYGTDMTIGADTALHRITEAIDAISSTAASHQRSFVVEVMGRNCGYLALMSALATSADWVFIPEHPPDENWEQVMCQVLRRGREAGRRDSIVVVAEGARDIHGKPITANYIKHILEDHLGEDTRVTILGHVQRGGSPSAFDRNMSTLLGYEAVQHLLTTNTPDEASLIGIRNNRVMHQPLMECVAKTHEIANAIESHDYEHAMDLRGSSFRESFTMMRSVVRARPHEPSPGQRRLRLAVLNAGGLAPGMNSATRAAVRLGIDQGHTILGVNNAFQGLIDGEITEFDWMSVSGWVGLGGSELGTNRKIPVGSDLYAIARNIEEHRIQGLLIIGGWHGYESAYKLFSERTNFPTFNIPIVCLPATINNDLPGSELSIGTDTALNSIVHAVDKIKQSAVAYRRCFVVEVMGRNCGYLALMSGMATGAERVYTPEEGITLRAMQHDIEQLMDSFSRGKRLGLIIRSENASDVYTAQFIRTLFEEEGKGLFDVRQATLGHLQQGGDPTPFDRIMATRFAAMCIGFLVKEARIATPGGACIGLQDGRIEFFSLEDYPRLMDRERERAKQQWWIRLRSVARVFAQRAPHAAAPPTTEHV